MLVSVPIMIKNLTIHCIKGNQYLDVDVSLLNMPFVLSGPIVRVKVLQRAVKAALDEIYSRVLVSTYIYNLEAFVCSMISSDSISHS